MAHVAGSAIMDPDFELASGGRWPSPEPAESSRRESNFGGGQMTRLISLLAAIAVCGCASTQPFEKRKESALNELKTRREQFTALCSKMPSSSSRESCEKQNKATFARFGYRVGSASDRASLERVISVIDGCTERESRAIEETGMLGLRSFLSSVDGCVNSTLAAR